MPKRKKRLRERWPGRVEVGTFGWDARSQERREKGDQRRTFLSRIKKPTRLRKGPRGAKRGGGGTRDLRFRTFRRGEELKQQERKGQVGKKITPARLSDQNPRGEGLNMKWQPLYSVDEGD